MFGQPLAQPPEDVHSVQARQFRIQHHNVGLDVHAKLHGRLPFARLADQLVVIVQPEDFDQHLADGGLVFDYDEAFH